MRKKIAALLLFIAIATSSISVLEAAKSKPCNQYLGPWEIFFEVGCSLTSGNCCGY